MSAWNNLSMREKAEMMKVAVRNGIKTLPEIRQAYNEFAEGGDVKQDDYYSIMEKVAKENYKNWGFDTPDEALVHALNDNTYNYKGYYKKYPQSQANADTHWTDEFKTVYHPTFSTESIYSGKKSEYNPLGLPGGTWIGETFIPSVWQTVENNKFAGGSYMEQAKSLIRKNEGWSAKPYKDAPTGRTWRSVGYGFNDSGFRDKYPEGISKHYEHGITRAQAEEELNHYLGKAERTLKSIYGKQWNAFTDGQKAAILDTYYQRPASVGKGSAFYNAVKSGKDATNYLGVSGYDKRNKGRREAFSGTREIPVTMQNMDAVMNSPAPVQENIDFMPLNPQVFGMQIPSYQVSTVIPEQPIVEAAQQQVPTPEQLERERILQERQERRDRLDKFNLLMNLSNPQQDSGLMGTVGMLTGSQYKNGGKIHIKPSHRGRLTELKKRTGKTEAELYKNGSAATRKMITFARNARKWKHGLGGNLFSGEDEPTQQMNNGLNLYRRTNNHGETEYIYQETPDSEEILLTPTNKRFSDDPTNWDYKDASGREYSPRMVSPSSSSTLEISEKMGPLEKYVAELNWRAKNDPASIALQGKYTMPAIAAAPFLAWAGEAAYPYVSTALANPYVDAGITSAFAGHGLNHWINEGINGWGDAAMTSLEVMPLGRLVKPVYEGIVQPGMRLFNSTLTSRPRYSPIIQRSVGTNITTGTSEETAKAVEKGRKTLLDWVKSPFYKARLEDEPLYRVADDVVADAGKMIEDVPIDISKTKLKIDPSGIVNGTTVTRPATQTRLPNGTIVADLDTGLDVNVASDLGKEADETTLHELLHYMTANSKGEPISQAGERIIKKGWMEPTETHFDAINIIHKNRSKSWQDFIMDQNNSLLPQYDPVVKMVMEEPDKAISFLQKAGRTEADAKSAVQSLRARYSEWYDIQEQRAYLQQLFHTKIRPNLKNPNDAAEIEEYLSLHPEVLDDYPAYGHIQEVRPGSLKDYAKYFSAALGTIPFIPKLAKDDGR